MLLYDFGTKEQLIVEILAEAQRREAELLTAWLEPPAQRASRRSRRSGAASARPSALHSSASFRGVPRRGREPDRYRPEARRMVGDWVDVLQASGTSRGVDTNDYGDLMIAPGPRLPARPAHGRRPTQDGQRATLFARLVASANSGHA